MIFQSAMLTAKGKPRKRVPARDRWAIEQFMERGYSTHSPHGHFAAVILNHCVKHQIPFELYYMPHGGYTVKRSECRSPYCECDEGKCREGKIDKRADEARRVFGPNK
jgi:hypothetical protein